MQVGRSATDTDTPADTGVTEYLRKLDSHTAPVLCLAFSPKSNLLVSGSFDESAIVWDVRRGKPLRVLPAHADPIWTVGFSAEGGMVVTGSADGLMYVALDLARAADRKAFMGYVDRAMSEND